MINLFEPNVGLPSLKLLENVFNSKWLGRGGYVSEFENKLCDFLHVSNDKLHTISCCTDAIFGAFQILGLESGGEVIVPSITFPAVGSAILAAGMVPRVVDINCESGNLCLDSLSCALSKNTVAVFITHYGGIPLDTKKLRELVGPKIYIIEDAACALGTFVDGVACGTEGDFGCWSFDAMKLLTCGEGGAIHITNSEKMNFAKEYFYLGLPSQTKSGIDRQATSNRWWEYQLNCAGRRSIFTNINAAIGLPQFDSLPAALSRREEIRRYYCQEFDLIGLSYLRQEDPRVTYSNYFFTIINNRRDDLAEFLKKKGIYSSFRYFPLNLIDLFKPYAFECPAAIKFSNTALNIPIHQSLTDQDVMLIAGAVREFCKH